MAYHKNNVMMMSTIYTYHTYHVVTMVVGWLVVDCGVVQGLSILQITMKAKIKTKIDFKS